MEFERIKIEDQQRYLRYLNECYQVSSDVSPTCMLGYQESNHLERAYMDGFCWQKDSVGGNEYYMPPVGDWSISNWKEIMQKNIPVDTEFWYVPEYLLGLWLYQIAKYIDFEECRDEWDYVCYLDKQIKAEGKKYKGFREQYNYFISHNQYAIEEITSQNLIHVRTLQDKFIKEKVNAGQSDDEMLMEDQAVRYVLEHFDQLPLLSGVLCTVDGKYVGYCMWEELDGVNMSIQTGNGNRKGTNQYFTIGIGVSIVIGIAITIVSLSFFMKIVGSLAGGNPEIVYFVKWYYMGLCFLPLIQPVLTVLYVIGLNEGKERLCSVSSIIQMLSNIILSIILCKLMGILGVSIATVISNGFADSFLYLLIAMTVTLVNIFIIKQFGNKELITFSVIIKLLNLLVNGYDGLGQAIQPLISIYSGEKNTKGIKSTMNLAVKYASIISVTVTVALLVFSRYLPRIFGIEEQLYQRE